MTISAQIIADSINPQGNRLTTLQLRYPRFIHAEFMTHRVFSRNASSSRAVPVKRLIEDIRRDPAMPIHWGRNMPGMQAREEHDDLVVVESDRFLMNDHGIEQAFTSEQAWRFAMENAIAVAEAFDAAGYHKQIVNRLLEPFSHINVVVTSTQWDNFFALRRHPDAQPEIKALADAMWDALKGSKPTLLRPGQWHLPYVREGEVASLPTDLSIKVSVARCARVSYLTHDGRETRVEEDIDLYHRLVGSQPLHASPAEHQGTPDNTRWVLNPNSMTRDLVEMFTNPHLHGNFVGWVQYRKTLPGENVLVYADQAS